MDEKISSFLLEMWFRWHQSLWMHVPPSVKVFIWRCTLVLLLEYMFPILRLHFLLFCDCVQNFSRDPGYDIPVPDVLVQPVMMATNFQML